MDALGILVIGALLGVLAERGLGRPIDRGLFTLQSRLGKVGPSARRLNGIWLTRYVYESSTRAGLLEDEYLVVVKQGRHGTRGRSLKRPEGSNLSLDLKVDHSVLSGTWAEYTPDQQRSYHGTCQLLLNAPGDVLEGKWMGFRSDNVIGVGPWEWRRLDTSTGRRAKKRCAAKTTLAWHKKASG